MSIDHSDVIVVSKLGSGWAAVQLTYTTEDFGSFWEPWTTGFGRYDTKEEAYREAREWAANEEIRLDQSIPAT